jgi:hypothetical protein
MQLDMWNSQAIVEACYLRGLPIAATWAIHLQILNGPASLSWSRALLTSWWSARHTLPSQLEGSSFPGRSTNWLRDGITAVTSVMGLLDKGLSQALKGYSPSVPSTPCILFWSCHYYLHRRRVLPRLLEMRSSLIRYGETSSVQPMNPEDTAEKLVAAAVLPEDS